MNWKRIAGAGLVTGIVINAGEFGIEPLLGPQMQNFFQRLGLSMPSEQTMVLLAVLTLILGVVTVWLYAALIPGFGRGMRTAAITGVVVWLLSCAFPNVAMWAFGLYDAKLFWFSTVWPLIETVVATMIGAMVYGGRAVIRPAPARAA
jgi:hypothetical protein